MGPGPCARRRQEEHHTLARAGIKGSLGLGAGGESRRPLGLAVVGGLLFSQTLTLYVTPVFFLYMEDLREHIAGRRAARAARRSAAETEPMPAGAREP